MAFYEYIQNNSGGTFAGPAYAVVIEADSPDEANGVALDHGLYFDDDYSIDCPCCGSRWSRAWSGDEGDPVPSYYGDPLSSVHSDEPSKNLGWVQKDYLIVYKDGTTKSGFIGKRGE